MLALQISLLKKLNKLNVLESMIPNKYFKYFKKQVPPIENEEICVLLYKLRSQNIDISNMSNSTNFRRHNEYKY